jgi:hypothetical protein
MPDYILERGKELKEFKEELFKRFVHTMETQTYIKSPLIPLLCKELSKYKTKCYVVDISDYIGGENEPMVFSFFTETTNIPSRKWISEWDFSTLENRGSPYMDLYFRYSEQEWSLDLYIEGYTFPKYSLKSKESINCISRIIKIFI